VGDMGTGRADELLAAREFDTQVLHPAGWRDAAII
jgi:hypothetical protein